jgi:hypothetical protein
MKKGTVNIILTLVALIPMTFYMLLSIYGLTIVLSNFDVNDVLILISMVFGILGYIGLVMNLKRHKKLKAELANFIFLLLGIIGFIMFISFEGGVDGWKWVILIEELDEWLVSVVPILITTLLTIIKAKRLTTMYKRH